MEVVKKKGNPLPGMKSPFNSVHFHYNTRSAPQQEYTVFSLKVIHQLQQGFHIMMAVILRGGHSFLD